MTALPPYDLGQLVSIDSYDERLPGTVVAVRALGIGCWEIRVEVLASFGVGVSRHVVDGSGREVERRSTSLGLVDVPRTSATDASALAVAS